MDFRKVSLPHPSLLLRLKLRGQLSEPFGANRLEFFGGRAFLRLNSRNRVTLGVEDPESKLPRTCALHQLDQDRVAPFHSFDG